MRRAIALLAGTLGAGVLVLALVGSSSGQGSSPPGDHYLCYGARDTNVPKLNPPAVSATDQFFVEPVMVDPKPSNRFCRPAFKNGGPVEDVNTQLVGYPLRASQILRQVVVSNQFGQFFLTVTRRVSLLVPTSNTGGPPDPQAPGHEHYVCYQAVQRPTVGDGFGEQVLTVLDLVLCNPASKNGSEIKDPDRHLLCFPVTGRHETERFTAVNQFGHEELDVGRESQFCLPSSKEVMSGA
jgi:hypothetical protein